MVRQNASRRPGEPFVHYNVGFIILSYLISFIGCVTTLELLHRRTSRRGAYNWYLLISSCITMGGVGIWCMHFVGNQAIILKPQPSSQQIVYSPSFTALSFFLPIVVLFVAFYILGATDRVNRYSLLASSILAGTAICGMHYLGQLGIANYHCSYRVRNVAGAAVIAVFASLIALGVFFRLRETWTNSWWKRSLCGAALACAVSGMHWTAAVGTDYKPREGTATKTVHARIGTIIVATVLSVVTCVILLCFALVTARRKNIYKTRSQQLVLACGYFSPDGRVMVTAEGGLPCAKITNHYVEKTFGEDELSRTHPTFVWVFKASRNWPAIKDLIAGMKRNLEADPAARKCRSGEATPIDEANGASLDFSTVFKQLFCVAAQNLAYGLHESLENLGLLFEEPLETGTIKRDRFWGVDFDLNRFFCNSSKIDSEKKRRHSYHFGRGQYLSITRQLKTTEVEKFASQGYRFASISSIAETMAKTMQVEQDWMLGRLERMRKSASAENLLAPGVHLVCFMLKPTVHKSFDVLVPTNGQNQLPLATLPLERLTTWQIDMLQKFENWTIASILKVLIHASGSFELEQDFRWQLYRAFSQLVELVRDPVFMMQAKFSSTMTKAPCRSKPGSNEPAKCTLLSIRMLQSINAQAPRSGLTYVPLSFFSAQQQMDAGPASHDRFARQARKEFAYCQRAVDGSKNENNEQLSKRKSWGDFRSGGLMPTSPRTPISFFRQSYSQKPAERKGGRESLVRQDAIVGKGVGCGEKEWVEMMEGRRNEGQVEVKVKVGAESKEEEVFKEVGLNGKDDEQSSEVLAKASSSLGDSEREGSSEEDGIGEVEGEGRGRDGDVKAGMETFVNELFALFKL